MTAIFHLMSGGAAAAVVKHVQARFEADAQVQLQGTYSAVGQMRDQLLHESRLQVASGVSAARVGRRRQHGQPASRQRTDGA